ncbi:alcohol dehydrogenase catalytic domain-containing protein [Novosphingobium sp.]|uniref:alcohol dehydrogenase catalytic domain-containing protein n=1 Tax=Novosphingobium sp. TaxID=1874826 RepID=UPI0031D9C28D
MKAIICEAPMKLTLQDRAAPQAGPDEALIRIRRVWLCGTDFHIFKGNQPFLSYPRVIGHAGCGRGCAGQRHQGRHHLQRPGFHKRKKALIGSRNALREDFQQVIDCLADGTIPTEPLHTHSFELEIQPSIMKAIGRF